MERGKRRMKVGIFGGGFKPFHTGHFSKVALALEENDEVYLFYGIQKKKEPKIGKRGRPLKDQQKLRIMGGSGREFTESMSTRIFDIIKSSLERKYGDRIHVIRSDAPVGDIIEKISEFKEDPPEKIKVYGRPQDLQRYYLKLYNTPDSDGGTRAKKYFGTLREDGILEFGTISSSDAEGLTPEELSELESSRITAALRGLYPQATDDELSDYANVSATTIRNSISSRDIDALKTYLPDFLDLAEEDRIVDILLGNDIRVEEHLRYFIRGMLKG